MRASSLTELAEEHLAAAHAAAGGRSSRTVVGGHENPGEATLHVLLGQVRMAAGSDTCDAAAGQRLVVPDARHSLEALTDCVVLLTVAKIGQAGP